MTVLKQYSKNFKIATVAILGRPNAGKSTLLNAIMESPLCATSDRPQTTRKNTKGVLQRYTGKKWTGQIVFVDTPGINFQKGMLERSFFNSVEEGLGDANIVLWIADARTFEKDLLDIEMGKIQSDRVVNWLQDAITKSAEDVTKTWLLVLSKADLVHKNELLPLIEKSLQLFPQFKEVVPLAAEKGLNNSDSNIEALLKVVDKYSHEGEPIFEKTEYTDSSSRELIREFVRETIFRTCKKEVPYETDCQILKYTESVGKRRPEVDAVIWVSKASLKPIVVGAQGQRIKEIGMAARKKYEELTGQEIILRLFVKVVDRWERRADLVQELGYGQIPQSLARST